MLSWWWAGPPAWTSPAPPSGAPPLATLQLAADETYQNGYFRQPAGLVWLNYKVREVALKLIFEMTPLCGVVLLKLIFEPTVCRFKHFHNEVTQIREIRCKRRPNWDIFLTILHTGTVTGWWEKKLGHWIQLKEWTFEYQKCWSCESISCQPKNASKEKSVHPVPSVKYLWQSVKTCCRCQLQSSESTKWVLPRCSPLFHWNPFLLSKFFYIGILFTILKLLTVNMLE